MNKYELLSYVLKNFELIRDDNNRAGMIHIPDNRVTYDRKGLDTYKFACLWLYATDPYSTVNSITGEVTIKKDDDNVDRVYESGITKEAYVILMASIKKQINKTGNIEPIQTMSDMEDALGDYKYTSEIVKKAFYSQAAADIIKNYAKVFYPDCKVSDEHAKYIDDDPKSYFEDYYMDKIKKIVKRSRLR